MYCCHCGKHINEHKLEAKHSSFDLKNESNEMIEIDSDANVYYVCPQCGHLIHSDVSSEEIKSLSQAAHSQLQRGSNNFAFGMAFNLIGLIIVALAISFLLLSFQTEGSVKVLNSSKSTFYIFVAMACVAVILLVLGIVFTVIGVSKKREYTKLLKDLNNKTFAQ